jgi:hypothetical protein
MSNVEDKVDNLTPKRATVKTISKPKEKKSGNLGLGLVAVLLITGVVLLADVDEFQPVQDAVFGKEDIPVIPGDVQLYTFSDPFDNNSVNVEFWLINIGDKTVTDLEVFVRARDHNGTILFSDMVDTTTLLLRTNETCSGWYTVPINSDTLYVTHTIEIDWDDGRASYLQKTTIAPPHIP